MTSWDDDQSTTYCVVLPVVVLACVLLSRTFLHVVLSIRFDRAVHVQMVASMASIDVVVVVSSVRHVATVPFALVVVVDAAAPAAAAAVADGKVADHADTAGVDHGMMDIVVGNVLRAVRLLW